MLPNDVVLWDGPDGILKNGMEYLIWQVWEGKRGEEFMLKHKDWQIVEPRIWWDLGEPFIIVGGGK